MSGGNHELFHSNMLAFLGRYYPSYFKSILGIENDLSFDEVTRESDNFDIGLIKNEKYVGVIENKMKSFPQLNQLRRYEENKNCSDNCKFILLTMLSVSDHEKPEKWTQVTYKTLADNMEKHFNKLIMAPCYFKELVGIYIFYLRSIVNDVNVTAERFNTATTSELFFDNKKNGHADWQELFKKKILHSLLAKKIKEKIDPEYSKYLQCAPSVIRGGAVTELFLYFDGDKLIEPPLEKKKTIELNRYWIQLIEKQIHRGFMLYSPENATRITDAKDQGSSNDKKTSWRKDFIINVWKECEKIPPFKTIGDDFPKEVFDNQNGNFIPKIKNKSYRAYLYDNLSIVYFVQDIEEKQVHQLACEISKEIKETIEKLLTNSESKESKNS